MQKLAKLMNKREQYKSIMVLPLHSFKSFELQILALSATLSYLLVIPFVISRVVLHARGIMALA
jgi:hypothetical protein